jgi:hypothetical protein
MVIKGMETKIYCERRFVLEHEGLHFDVFLKTFSYAMGSGFTSKGMQPDYEQPQITVEIGGEHMEFGAFQGADPTMTEEESRQYVQRHLLTWKHIGLFAVHLSQEAAARRRERHG